MSKLFGIASLRAVPSDWLHRWVEREEPNVRRLILGEKTVPALFVRNPRARRYILRVRRDGFVHVTVPRGGSLAFAMAFARRHALWIEKEMQRRQAEEGRIHRWEAGSTVLLRGERVALQVEGEGPAAVVRLGEEIIPLPHPGADLRQVVEQHLWTLAEKELIPRTRQLASMHDLVPDRIVVRNQRSRWGSCSPRRTISLNWRLIHAPFFVRDYLILHELCHLKEMNHSSRFWKRVAEVCPGYAQAEAWLDAHADLLR